MQQQSLDVYDEQFRAPDLRAALASLADQGETERGAVFTRPEVVASLLDLAGYPKSAPYGGKPSGGLPPAEKAN